MDVVVCTVGRRGKFDLATNLERKASGAAALFACVRNSVARKKPGKECERGSVSSISDGAAAAVRIWNLDRVEKKMNKKKCKATRSYLLSVESKMRRYKFDSTRKV